MGGCGGSSMSDKSIEAKISQIANSDMPYSEKLREILKIKPYFLSVLKKLHQITPL